MGEHDDQRALKVGHGRCQCAACGAKFAGLSAFDAHRVHVSGEAAHRSGFIRRCLGRVYFKGAGLMKDPAGYWSNDPNLLKGLRGGS